MGYLIITINAPLSRKNGLLILETYYTKNNKINNKGIYKGGNIEVVDIFNNFYTWEQDNALIQKLFDEYCLQVSPNRFYVNIDNFIKIHECLRCKDIVYCDTTEKTLFLIKSINFGILNKRGKYQYQIGNYIFIGYSDSSLSINKNLNLEYSIEQITPVSRLYYSLEENVYSLYFDYAGKKVGYLDKTVSFKLNNKILIRNYKFEKSVSEMLNEKHFIKLTQGRYIYSGHIRKDMLAKTLLSSRIIIEDDESVIIPNIKVSKSDSDWFEIDLSYKNITGEISDLSSQIDIFFKNNELNIGDKRILLPESIIQAKEDILLDGNKLKIEQKHIFQLLRILYESKAHIYDFFSYENVKLLIPKKNMELAFPYQIDGIKWLKFLYLNHFGGCLADDMGLGKSFQTISFFEDSEVKENLSKVLIIAPKTLLTNWKKEFEKFDTTHSVGIYHGNKRDKSIFSDYDIILTTYNTAYMDLQDLNQFYFSIVVFDEIQTIKNYKSVMSEALKRIHSSVRIGLSGTPMENSISELWNIMDVLNPGALKSHIAFMNRYNNGRNYDELKSILNLFILRRMKKDVLKELPLKSEQVVYCDMDKEQRILYTSINVAVKKEIMNLKAFAAPIVLKGITLLRECCCHPLLLNEKVNVKRIEDSCKLEALKILVDNLFSSGHKILIFSNFTSMLQLIKAELEKIDEYHDFIFYLDGQTKNRSELVNQFEISQKGIFLISIKAGGVGLNLISAQDVIIYDPWWNPFVEQQAIDRVYRIGQQKPVSVFKLIAADTLEEKIIDLQKNKEYDFDELINGVSPNKNMDLNTILELLQ